MLWKIQNIVLKTQKFNQPGAFSLSSRIQYERGKNRWMMFHLNSVGQTLPFEFPGETAKDIEKPGPASTEGKQSHGGHTIYYDSPTHIHSISAMQSWEMRTKLETVEWGCIVECFECRVLPKVNILWVYAESRILWSGVVGRKPEVGHQCGSMSDDNFKVHIN